VGWSPDGRVLVTSAPGPRSTLTYRYLAVSPLGHTLWSVDNGSVFGATWSAGGLVAVPTGGQRAGAQHTIAVHDETGKLRFSVHFGTQSASTTWSPDGHRVALALGHTLQVRTTTGHLLLERQLRGIWAESGLGNLLWDGNSRIAVVPYGSCACRATLVEVPTGKTSPASDRFALPTSSDGKLAILTTRSGTGFAIEVAPTAGGQAATYTEVPACDGGGRRVPGADGLQFVPGGHSILYETVCDAASG
jgi:hypothetical protein